MLIIVPIIAIILVFGLSYLFSDWIKKHHLYLYLGAILLGILAIILKDKTFTQPFNKGFLGLAFFYVVMIIGVLNKDSKLFKRLFKVRPELSITGFILLTPHAIFYLLDKFLGTYSENINIVLGLLTYLIMVPLFITSFKVIENKKQFFKWKKLQRFAYIIYLLIFIHLIVVVDSTSPNFYVYLIMFIPYFIYKPIHFFLHEKPAYQKMKSKENNQ
jgi:DMSO/TMAO reductase YedYZ heme-binding membrane subunit